VNADGRHPEDESLAGLAEGYREWLAGWEEVRVIANRYYRVGS
jgi:hypothetical protein